MSRKGRKAKAVKMEAELKAEAVPEKIEEKVEEKKFKHKWLDDKFAGIKTCDACGAQMRGWAYREKFKYCPMCGVEME